MKPGKFITRFGVAFLTVGLAMAFILPAYAGDDGNWRRGRIYYRMVCTDCHKDLGHKTISPMSRTIADWKAYIAADKHDASGKSNPSLNYYTSQAYRHAVKDTNKAAAKFIDMDDKTLADDIRAWVIHGAKDSDTPARCQ